MLITTDAVLTAFFAANGVCDKMELVGGQKITSGEKTFLTRIQAKHAAATPLTKAECMKCVRILEHYFRRAN